MTPGTLSLGFKDVDESGCPRVLLVHAVYGADPDEVIAGLADMEERLAPHVKEVA
jgi:monovalent cation/H+ antiporter subunit E